MDETVKQEETIETAEERTFTQAELDAIVGDRLKRERSKFADYEELKEKAGRLDAIEEANKSELQRATERVEALSAELESLKHADALRSMRERISTETGVPMSLITAENEEDAMQQAKQIIEFARPAGYPSVRDGGEVTHSSKSTARQQFADWAQQAFG